MSRKLMRAGVALLVWLSCVCDAHGAGGPIQHTVLVAARPSYSFVVPVAVDPRAGYVYAEADCPTSICLKLVQSATGKLRRTILLHQQFLALAVAPAANRVFLPLSNPWADATRVEMLDAASGAVLRTITLPLYPYGFMTAGATAGHIFITSAGTPYCPNQRCAIVESGVAMLDARTGRLLHVFHAPGEIVAVGADERARRLMVASFSSSSTMSVFDSGSGRLLNRIPIAAQPERIIVDERTGRAFVLAMPNPADPAPLRAGRIYVVDTRGGTLLRTTVLSSTPSSMAVDTRTGRVYVSEWGQGHFVHLGPMPSGPGIAIWALAGRGLVQVLDARTGMVARTDTVGVDPMSLAVDSQHGRVFVVNAGGHSVGTNVVNAPITVRGPRTARGSLSVLDGASGQILRTLNVGTTPDSIVLDPRSQRAFIGDLGDNARPASVVMLDTSKL